MRIGVAMIESRDQALLAGDHRSGAFLRNGVPDEVSARQTTPSLSMATYAGPCEVFRAIPVSARKTVWFIQQ